MTLSQPFFQVRELDRTRLLQCARGEPPHPVVVDAQRGRYRPVLPDTGFDRFPRLLNARLDRNILHSSVDTIVVTCHYSSTSNGDAP